MKLQASDNMAPIKAEMMHLVNKGSTVIEFGCGDGDLLFKLAPQIRSGLGIDKSKTLIDKALRKKKLNSINNLDFLRQELDENYTGTETFDLSLVSLFFHVIPMHNAVYLLNKMKKISGDILICAFTKPGNAQQKLTMWLDQRLSSHYKNFRAYQKQGYMEGILDKAQIKDYIKYDTYIPFLKIYNITLNNSSTPSP